MPCSYIFPRSFSLHAIVFRINRIQNYIQNCIVKTVELCPFFKTLSKPIFSKISQPSELCMDFFFHFAILQIFELKKKILKISLKKLPDNNHLLNGSCTDTAVRECLHLQTETIYKNQSCKPPHINLWEINAHGFCQEVAMNYYLSEKQNKFFPKPISPEGRTQGLYQAGKLLTGVRGLRLTPLACP